MSNCDLSWLADRPVNCLSLSVCRSFLPVCRSFLSLSVDLFCLSFCVSFCLSICLSVACLSLCFPACLFARLPPYRSPTLVLSRAPAPPRQSLFFLDQNISSRVVNSPRHKMVKGPAYHQDMLVLGLITAVLSVVGLPWQCAATVQVRGSERTHCYHRRYIYRFHCVRQ